MKPRFHRNQERARWSELDARDRGRAALLHAFLGGARAHPKIDTLLGRTARYAIRRGRGIRAEWWQVGDAGLMFDVGTARIVGEARGGDFAMRGKELWASLVEAVKRPNRIDWTVDARKPTWRAPATTAQLVRAIDKPKPKPKQPGYKVGDAISVLYAWLWYPGFVKAKTAVGYRVSYVGWDWAENVARERLRPRVTAKTPDRYAVGDKVDIAYGDEWFAGSITKVLPRKRYAITYTGWSAAWDERVGLERLRPSTL